MPEEHTSTHSLLRLFNVQNIVTCLSYNKNLQIKELNVPIQCSKKSVQVQTGLQMYITAVGILGVPYYSLSLPDVLCRSGLFLHCSICSSCSVLYAVAYVRVQCWGYWGLKGWTLFLIPEILHGCSWLFLTWLFLSRSSFIAMQL